MVAAEVVASTVVVADSAVEGTSAEEDHARVTAEGVVLGLPEPIGAEPVAVTMELMDRDDLVGLTELADPAHTAAGRTVARPTARDTLVHMVAGLGRHQQVHATVQFLMAAQTRRQPRGITGLPEPALIAAQAQGILRQELRALRAERWLPIDQGRL
jgi:hypothetical protein